MLILGQLCLRYSATVAAGIWVQGFEEGWPPRLGHKMYRMGHNSDIRGLSLAWQQGR